MTETVAITNDEVVDILFREIRQLRAAGSKLDKALRYGGQRDRVLALAHWEMTRRGFK